MPHVETFPKYSIKNWRLRELAFRDKEIDLQAMSFLMTTTWIRKDFFDLGFNALHDVKAVLLRSVQDK